MSVLARAFWRWWFGLCARSARAELGYHQDQASFHLEASLRARRDAEVAEREVARLEGRYAPSVHQFGRRS